jgi:multiple sugar transport system permease protein
LHREKTRLRAPSRSRSSLLAREAWEGRLFVLPWVVGFLVFTAGPMLYSLFLAFTDYDVLSPPKWVGVVNFVNAFSNDPLFWLALFNTAYYVVIAVPLYLAASFLVALAVNRPVRGVNVYRTLYYLPSITPAVASSILWLMLFQSDFGLVNSLLTAVGAPTPKWLFDPDLTKLVFVAMGFWGIGSSMVTFLAGLQGISETLYDAAAIDGAGVLARFRHVTVPMMTPLIFFNLILGIIASFQIFTSAYIITRGGPANSSLFYVLYLYNNGWQFLKMGYASALAWILFLIILGFTMLQFKLADRWVYYEGGLRPTRAEG